MPRSTTINKTDAHLPKCGRPARSTGKNTDHFGVGSCWLHGGDTLEFNGRWSVKRREALKERMASLKAKESDYLDLEKVATGEHWYGTTALELGLADALKTSDELLAELASDHDLYRLAYKIKQPLQKRLMANADAVLERVEHSSWRRRFESRLPR